MFILEFFRDTLSGLLYILYLIICIIAFFYFLGIVADRKREAINKKLKEKKTYDIESGKEAAIAAMESKQVLDVNNDVNSDDQLGGGTQNQNATLNSALNSMSNMPDAREAQKDDSPNVMILNSADVNNTSNAQPVVNTSQGQEVQQPQAQEPLVINSSSIKM